MHEKKEDMGVRGGRGEEKARIKGAFQNKNMQLENDMRNVLDHIDKGQVCDKYPNDLCQYIRLSLKETS